MGCLDSLARTQPRENSGSVASRRFDYQIHWGLKRLFELERENIDYVMIFDYHDDIVVCSPPNQNEFIDFYQVKTRKNDYWKKGALLSSKEVKEKDAGLSILAKLYQHEIDFKECRYLYFVTNSYFPSTISSSQKDLIPFADLKPSFQKELKESITKDLQTTNIEFERLFFYPNQFSLDDFQYASIGIISSFLKNDLGVVIADVESVYESLISEIRNRNNKEKIVSNPNQLLSKSITHKEFRDFLNGVAVLKSFNQTVTTVLSNLRKYEIPYRDIFQLKQSYQQINTELKDYNNFELQKLIAIIKSKDTSMIPFEDETEWEFIKRYCDSVLSDYENCKKYSTMFVRALIAYIIEWNG